jgi:DNA-binding CsgD family transcriptional regulator
MTNQPVTINLTKREKELLLLIADGFTDPEMSVTLGISKNTVSTHRKKLLRKMNVKNSAHLVKKACLMGLIS